ncbi:hypothetical protein Fleli_3096 [Bernardetia litoralis DSM 6794]|uniref:Uncharacterized protein n=1 Tax=Bernardetia litoralis (strain ATCC 23117 / DSM 6794 / NBRC 15988 / NCIMB 1366 / Fx l1 / Sio-4) TaxID=880071 RepID=I4ANA1_BERLS|nr:hypothetical protein [Bernardetia litoralis]AFM05436.1 hypothetical protein Fleli_3096 [Bernardetia litoralis DSM 6794]
MKIILLVTCLFFIVCSFSFQTLNTITLDLAIGDFYNNHSKRIFRYSEKKWHLENDTLTYNLTGEDYFDTLSLSKVQIEKIIQIIENQDLKKDITLVYNPPFKGRGTHTKKIKGELHINSEVYKYKMEESVYSILENKEYNNIQILETYLDSLTKKE